MINCLEHSSNGLYITLGQHTSRVITLHENNFFGLIMYVKDTSNNAFYVYAKSVTVLIKEVLSLFEKVILDEQPFRFTKYYHVSSR